MTFTFDADYRNDYEYKRLFFGHNTATCVGFKINLGM